MQGVICEKGIKAPMPTTGMSLWQPYPRKGIEATMHLAALSPVLQHYGDSTGPFHRRTYSLQLCDTVRWLLNTT